ncbi:MAG TPA: TonB family protein [Terriglobales bacterium]|nr:TonB family protein [Terriglobales bacterium]
MIELWKQREGEVINGEFHLRQYLGGSDHSAVFLTERSGQNPQKAAIKLIPADPYNAERQLSRWAIAAELSHPHLLRLFQMGRCQLGDRRLLYLVMEHAQEDLSQVLPHRALTLAELGDMLPPLLDALTFLHGKGLVHGLVKPSNVMAVDDRLRLSSDGLRGAREPSVVPHKRSVYDPPEILNGNVLPAGDVWSLGITLVQALTQRLPVWNGTESDEPRLPETMPPQYLDIARHCLRRDPSLRWTIGEIAARIQSAPPVVPKSISPGRNSFVNWGYMVPIAAVLLAGLVFAGRKLSSRHPGAQQSSSSAPAEPQLHARPEQKPIVPKIEKASPVHGKNNQPSSLAAPRQSPPPTKTLAGPLVKGAVVEQVLPNVPQSASDTITGTVRVRVRVAVDPTGNVTSASLDSPGPSKYFANLAMGAARRWKFEPPQKDGQDIASEWILTFGFKKTSNTVSPVEVAP